MQQNWGLVLRCGWGNGLWILDRGEMGGLSWDWSWSGSLVVDGGLRRVRRKFLEWGFFNPRWIAIHRSVEISCEMFYIHDCTGLLTSWLLFPCLVSLFFCLLHSIIPFLALDYLAPTLTGWCGVFYHDSLSLCFVLSLAIGSRPFLSVLRWLIPGNEKPLDDLWEWEILAKNWTYVVISNSLSNLIAVKLERLNMSRSKSL